MRIALVFKNPTYPINPVKKGVNDLELIRIGKISLAMTAGSFVDGWGSEIKKMRCL
jgi:hypothetical protein